MEQSRFNSLLESISNTIISVGVYAVFVTLFMSFTNNPVWITVLMILVAIGKNYFVRRVCSRWEKV